MSSETAPAKSISTTQSTPTPAEAIVDPNVIEGETKSTTDASGAQSSAPATAEAIVNPNVIEEPFDEQSAAPALVEAIVDLKVSEEPESSDAQSSPPIEAIDPNAIEEPKSTTGAPDAQFSSTPDVESAPSTAPEELNSTLTAESQPSTIIEEVVTLSYMPMAKLSRLLPSIIEEAGHDEIWGVTLIDESDVPTSIILEKFLQANHRDSDEAGAQLTNALKWRKMMNPAKLLSDVEFNRAKFGNLGYVTSYERADGSKEVITWNIYGGVKDFKSTFGDVDE